MPLDDCGSLQLSLGGNALAGRNVTVCLDGSSELEAARVIASDSCDDEPCAPPQFRPVLGGFVAAQELSRTGRNRGELVLEFAEGTISGTYDAVVP